jgi:hypothetical protein
LCEATALSAFGNERKIHAIAQVADFVNDIGFARFKTLICSDPIQTLQTLPFIGPVTSFHLAKNLGFNTAKPDRHLARMADWFGFPDTHTMCNSLSETFGDSVCLVDTILWRFAEQKFPGLAG